jgi:hypothetical protein
MSITIIPNQPIRLQNEDDIDLSCDCLGQNFCQLVNKNDNTQFQISSSDQVSNGDFDTDLTGWDIYEAITGTVYITNESSESECDGEVTITASGGTGPYTYSIDNGVTFQSADNFANLCEGDYAIIIKDSNDNTGSVEFTIYVNVDCSLYEGATIQDLIDDGITLGQLYNCTLGDLQP